MLKWIVGISHNPGNQFQRYAAGGHGIEMFAPHPELSEQIVAWFDTTLRKTPGKAPINHGAPHNESNILETIDEPGGASKAALMLSQARKRNPSANLFSEQFVNLIGYDHLQNGDTKGAIDIFRLNTTAFPNSPNTYDSLSEALAVDGQKKEAVESAEKALKLLESDTKDSEGRRKLIRDSSEHRLEQLRPSGT